MKGGISASVAGQAFIATEAVAGHMIRHMPMSSAVIRCYGVPYRDRVVRNTNRRVLQNLYRKGAAFRL